MVWATLVHIDALGAQTGDPAAHEGGLSTEQLIDTYDPSRANITSGPLPETQVSRVTPELSWRDWRNDLADGESRPEDLKEVRRHTISLGHRNAARYAFGSMAELQSEGTAETMGGATLVETLEHIEQLVPELPYAHLARAHILVQAAPSRVPEIVTGYARGVRSAWQWPNTRLAWGLQGLLVLLGASIVASTCFVLGQSIRHVGTVTRDLQRYLPSAFSKRQILVLLGLGVLTLAFVYRSPLIGIGLALLIASPPQHWRERCLSGLCFGLIALLPTLDAWMADATRFQGSLDQELLEAQYLHCDDACLERLEAHRRSADRTDRETDRDGAVLYTWALVHLRGGDASATERALHQLQETEVAESLEGHALNLTGAAMIARGRSDEAVDLLERSASHLPSSPAPLFNLARAHQKRGDSAASKQAFSRAVGRDVVAVSRARTRRSKNPASFLMLEPLPRHYFWNRHRRQSAPHSSLIEASWQRAAGPHVPFERAPLFAGAGALVLLLTGLLRGFGFASTPCPHCGMAREPGDDDRTRGDPRCYPCFRTFFGGGDLPYDTRRHYEQLLERHVQWFAYLRRGCSLIAPGTGHVVAGYAFTGWCLTFVMVLGGVLIYDPTWSWQPPYALMYEDWLGLSIIGWVLGGGAAWIALRAAIWDLEPHVDS